VYGRSLGSHPQQWTAAYIFVRRYVLILLRHSCNLLPHCRSPIKPLFFPPPSSFPPRKLTLCHLQSNPQPVSPPSPPHPRFRCAAQSTKDNGQGSRRRATTRRVVSPPRNRPSKPIPRDLPSVSRATDRWSFANQTSLSNPPRGSTRSPPPPDSLSLLPPRLAAPSPHTPLCRVPLYAIVLPNQSHATSHRYPAPPIGDPLSMRIRLRICIRPSHGH